MSKQTPMDIKEFFAEEDELPSVLLPYQSLLLSTTSPVVFIEKSRRIGMTWGIGADAVLVAASAKGEGGMDVFYIGYNLEMAREFIDTCASWAKAFNQACNAVEEFMFEKIDKDGNTKEIKAFRIEFASGYEIVALPSSPRSLRGKQGYIIIDEAAFHDDLEELLKAAYAMLIWGGRVAVISTHDGVDNAFNVQINAISEKRKGFEKHALIKVTFRDAIEQGLYKRICLTSGKVYTPEGEQEFIDDIYGFYGDGAEEELDVIPKRSGGTYLPGAIVEPCMWIAPIVRLELKDEFFLLPAYEKERQIQDWCVENLKPHLDSLDHELIHHFGFDFARSGDLCVFAPLAVEKILRRRIPFHLEMRNVPFSQQEQILFYAIDRLPRFQSGFADATGNGAQIAEKMQERYGLNRIFAIKINVPWYVEALPPYKGAFQDRNILIPKDSDVLQDHRTAIVVDGAPQIPRLKGSDKKQRHGDTLIAYAGAYWASLQETHEYGYIPAFDIKPRIMPMTPPRDIAQPVKSRAFGNERGAY